MDKNYEVTYIATYRVALPDGDEIQFIHSPSQSTLDIRVIRGGYACESETTIKVGHDFFGALNDVVAEMWTAQIDGGN